MRVKKLKLHPHKMEVLMVGPVSTRATDCDLMMDGVVLHWKAQICSLGVLLALLLEKQVGRFVVVVLFLA